MPRKDDHVRPESDRREMTRLMQIHVDTHPERIARRYGVTAQYVRQLWRERLQQDMATYEEAFRAFAARVLKRMP
jgi:endonuclease III